jgi:hypothetical protein
MGQLEGLDALGHRIRFDLACLNYHRIGKVAGDVPGVSTDGFRCHPTKVRASI